ncbi:MAG TPA: GNAT family N-acetyltransferase [Chitinophagaceae bacterium]|nr:GNAT family N-acetyltransferase [Chitinophagaceae bacterium]
MMTVINEIEIKKAGPADLQQLQAIARQTFFETYSIYNTEENMKKYLEEDFGASRLNNELSNPDSQFYLVFSDGKTIGYLKLNSGKAQTELKDSNAVEIERIYVSKDFHGKKIGQLLYEKALEVATDLKASYLWLGVWEKNPRAIRFYQKNGFEEFGKHIFKLGEDEQVDFLMKKML